MRLRRSIVAGFGAAALLLTAALATAQAGGCSGGGGGISAAKSCGDPSYVNPFKRKDWDASRIDMGVDYEPHKRVPFVAIGDAKVLGSNQHSGWPGGAYLYYKLLSGDHKGDIIYIAEQIKHLVPKGRVDAGDRLGFAMPSSTGIETGWAERDGQPRAASCYHEGRKTNSGKEMARFLHSLGAKLRDRPGDGPDYPTGKRC
jgi:hypothetical protein